MESIKREACSKMRFHPSEVKAPHRPAGLIGQELYAQQCVQVTGT